MPPDVGGGAPCAPLDVHRPANAGDGVPLMVLDVYTVAIPVGTAVIAMVTAGRVAGDAVGV